MEKQTQKNEKEPWLTWKTAGKTGAGDGGGGGGVGGGGGDGGGSGGGDGAVWNVEGIDNPAWHPADSVINQSRHGTACDVTHVGC